MPDDFLDDEIEELFGEVGVEVGFGGEHAHKAFALAVGLQTFVEALAGDDGGALFVVARPEADPVPALRELAGGVRLPGDR